MRFLQTLTQPVVLLQVLVLASTGLAKEAQVPLSSDTHSRQPHRVAIIGGGAGGSSAAYHLQHFADQSEHDFSLDITLYEKELRVGGRTTTVNAFDDPAFPVELGGSIFVKANHILYNFTRDFGLDATSRSSREEGHSDYDLGVWDGEQFVFKQSSSDSRWQGYWDIVKLLWKYGSAPIKIRNLTQAMLDKFLSVYDEPLFPFSSLTGIIEQTGLIDDISLDGKTMLEAKGAGELHRHVTTALERAPVINVTPQYSYVDLHIDYGMDGISAVLGDCQKLIILFPPSCHNLGVLQRERGSQAKLARTMPLLEYGLVDRLDSTNAIFIPSGWAHATFTTRGGFLVSVDCVTKRTVWSFSRYLQFGLYSELDSKQQGECWYLFLDCLEYALACHEILLVTRSWYNVKTMLKENTDIMWKRKVSQVWRQMTDSSLGAMIEDGLDRAQLPIHQFWERHLSWLHVEGNAKY